MLFHAAPCVPRPSEESCVRFHKSEVCSVWHTSVCPCLHLGLSGAPAQQADPCGGDTGLVPLPPAESRAAAGTVEWKPLATALTPPDHRGRRRNKNARLVVKWGGIQHSWRAEKGLFGELLDWLFQVLWDGTKAMVSKGKWTERL